MTTSATRIGHASGAFRDLPRMTDPGTRAYIGDAFANDASVQNNCQKVAVAEGGRATQFEPLARSLVRWQLLD